MARTIPSKKSLACALGGLLLAGAPAHGQQPATAACALQSLPRSDSLAVVLSGGGAHGLAHIGVLEVLDSLGVRPTLVVGTSMGAVIGAMYASGMSGRQIDSVVRQLPLEELFRRSPSMTFVSSGDLGAPIVTFTPAFVVEQLGTTVRLQSPAARERQINALLDGVLLGPNIAAAGDFSRLPIPFVAVATDIRTRAPVLLDRGDLAQAVRASAAIPVVFAPVARDEQMLIDGGLSANVPVGVARARGARRMIISDVGDIASRGVDVRSTTGMLSYLLDFSSTSRTSSPSTTSRSGRRWRLRPPRLLARGDRSAHLLRLCGGARVDGVVPAGRVARAVAPHGHRRAATHRRSPRSAARRRFLRERLAQPAAGSGAGATSTGHLLAFSPVATVAPGALSASVFAMTITMDSRFARVGEQLDSRGPPVGQRGALSLGEWRQQLLLAVTGFRRRPLRTPNDARPGGITVAPPRSARRRAALVDVDARSAPSNDEPTASHETVRLYDVDGHELARPSTRDLVGSVGARALFPGGWQGLLGPIVHLWRDDASGTNQSQTAAGGLLRVARLWAPRTSGPDQSTPPAIVGGFCGRTTIVARSRPRI